MIDQTNSPDWVKDSIFYQIFPERFANGDLGNDPLGVFPWGSSPANNNFMGGDLQGILDNLPYLSSLGINAIYMTPIFIAESNHKYDTSDYFKVDPIFGDIDLFKKLVAVAHENNIRVVLDAVFNHCGDGFWAFKDIFQNGKNSKYYDWFILNGYPIVQNPPNYQTCGGVAYMPKLNTNNPLVQQHLLDVAAYWLQETNMDGWRLDVPWKLSMDFWRAFRKIVKQIRPDAYIVAEAWRDGLNWLQGDTADAIMNYPLRECILDYCARDAMDAEDFNHFVMRLYETYGHDAPLQLNLLGSHDTARILTQCDGDSSRAILAFISMFTSVGAPMLYYGDENGMLGENDPDCRRCMEWDPSNWNQNIRNVILKLIELRRNHTAIRRGSYEALLTFNGIYAYRRIFSDDQVIVVLNPREYRSNILIPVPDENTPEEWIDVFSGIVYSCNRNQIQIPDLLSKQGLILIPHTKKN
jgi:cyclomaltodextrinase / maltogenic alpha-amylase / neopullulanase